MRRVITQKYTHFGISPNNWIKYLLRTNWSWIEQKLSAPIRLRRTIGIANVWWMMIDVFFYMLPIFPLSTWLSTFRFFFLHCCTCRFFVVVVATFENHKIQRIVISFLVDDGDRSQQFFTFTMRLTDVSVEKNCIVCHNDVLNAFDKLIDSTDTHIFESQSISEFPYHPNK